MDGVRDGPPDESRALFTVGGPIDRCSASLRVFGENLNPDDVTAMLGVAPTSACRKGDVTRRKVTTRAEPRGKWLLGIEHRTGTTLEAVINELLDRMTDDLGVWADLTTRFQADLFCGLHMEQWNRGLDFSPHTLKRIADRSLRLGLDIYYVEDDGPG